MFNNLCLGLENVNKQIRKNKVPEMTLQHPERNIELLFYLGDYYIVSFGVRASTSAYSCMLSLCGIQVIYIIFEGPLFFPEIRQGMDYFHSRNFTIGFHFCIKF